MSRRIPARWRKRGPAYSLQWELWRGPSRLGTVAQTQGGWYWYGSGHNSLWDSAEPMTVDEAKAACKAYAVAREDQP